MKLLPIKRYIISALIPMGLAACTNNRVSQQMEQKSPGESSLKGCYLGVIKQDTIQLAITSVNGNIVEGSLLYDFYEKDRSEGSIKGEFKDGVLLADYTYQSEGQVSKRQVTFKRTEKGFIEGYGESKMKGAEQVFTDTASLSYDSSPVLIRTESCLP